MNEKPANRFGLIMAVYLLGLVIGGLYVGMVAPVRTVVQGYFGIGNAQGIWIITIYALFYAAFIPVFAKAADRMGRKPVFLICMAVFCLGAVLCGLSGAVAGSSLFGANSGFAVLLAGRVLQAVGACGVIPLANAEIGSSAPPEKRGFALGITAATSGIANVLGAGVGSAVIGAVGQANWPVLFYACLPFGILAIVAGVFVLPKGERGSTGKIDALGSAALVAMVFLVLLWIQSITEEPGSSPLSVVPFVPVALIVGAALSTAVLVVAERRSSDPILNPKFFTSFPMLVTLAISFFIGAMTNSMTLVPEFAEAALGLDAGMGGTYMVVIGAFSMAGPPLGGKLIDRFGAKPVLVSGLAVATLGYLFLALVTSSFPNVATLVVGLALLGLGLGFCMGAPVNYMMFENARQGEVNSALGVSMLVRQVAISISPALYISFVTAGEGAAGYAPMLFAAAASSAIALVIAAFYRKGEQH